MAGELPSSSGEEFNFYAGDESVRDAIYEAAMTHEEIEQRKAQVLEAFSKLFGDVSKMSQEQLDTLAIIRDTGDLPAPVLAMIDDIEVAEAMEQLEEPVTKDSVTHAHLVAYIMDNQKSSNWFWRLGAHLRRGGSLTETQVRSAYMQMDAEKSRDAGEVA